MSDQHDTPVPMNIHVGGKPMAASVIISIILGSILAGAVTGGVVTERIHKRAMEQALAAQPPVVDTTAQGQTNAVTALTDLDLTKPLCDPAWLNPEGISMTLDGEGQDLVRRLLLCREVLCWQQGQSTTTKAEATGCDAISNLANSAAILALCGDTDTPAGKACIAIVNARK